MHRSNRSPALFCCLITMLMFFGYCPAFGRANDYGMASDKAVAPYSGAWLLPVNRDDDRHGAKTVRQGTDHDKSKRVEAKEGKDDSGSRVTDDKAVDAGHDDEKGDARCDTKRKSDAVANHHKNRSGKGASRHNNDSGRRSGGDGKIDNKGGNVDQVGQGLCSPIPL